MKRSLKPQNPQKPIFSKLPIILEKAISYFDKEEDQTLILLGCICSLGSIFTNYYGVYFNQVLFPNLFLFVSAPPASGKGKLRFCRKLIEPIHKKFVESNNKKVVSFILPANSSATGVYELLDNNGGKGIIFETEGDTLSQMFKQDFGNYSDGLRKSFHHEPITYYRRGDSENVNIDEPKLSVLLTGTPNQVLNLIPGVENGLASRFLYYNYDPPMIWCDPFANSKEFKVQDRFEELGSTILDYHEFDSETKEFRLTNAQEEKFNSRFEKLVDLFINEFGKGFRAFVYRAATSAFRICMILTATRNLLSTDENNVIYSSDEDLETALILIAELLWHSGEIYLRLSSRGIKSKFKSETEKALFENLPQSFSKKEFLRVSDSLGIKLKTSENYLDKFLNLKLIKRISQGNYKKNT